MWIRATSVGDHAFTFDTRLSAEQQFGLPDEIQLPLVAPVYGPAGQVSYVPFAIYDEVYLFTRRSCNGTFLNGCEPVPYAFQTPDSQSNWFAQTQLSLQPDEFLDFHHGNLLPVAGGAPAGTYTLTNLFVGMGLRGRSEEGDELTVDLFSFGTCSTGEPNCGFIGTVVGAIPEPGTWAMMVGGLAVVGVGARRRRRQG